MINKLISHIFHIHITNRIRIITLLQDLPIAQISFVDSTPAEEPAEASNPLLKLIDDMNENEAQAAAAVEEVASLTEQAPASNGFTVFIDDDDEEDDNSFSGRIEVSDENN